MVPTKQWNPHLKMLHDIATPRPYIFVWRLSLTKQRSMQYVLIHVPHGPFDKMIYRKRRSSTNVLARNLVIVQKYGLSTQSIYSVRVTWRKLGNYSLAAYRVLKNESVSGVVG